MPSAESTAMFKEAASGAAVAERVASLSGARIAALGRRLRELNPALVVTCARGSSDHAATFAKYLIETMVGVPVASHAPSITSVYKRQVALDRALFLAISQSGGSPDLVQSAQQARSGKAFALGLINAVDSPLEKVCDDTLRLYAGAERSVAATKSFLATLIAVASLVAHWSNDDALQDGLKALPAALTQAWEMDWGPAIPVLEDAQHLFVIGRGLGLGIAQEIALKTKETCALHGEAYSAAEVRHGPMALVKDGFPVLILAPGDATRQGVVELAAVFVERGAQVMVAGAADATLPDRAIRLPLPPVPHPALLPIVTVQAAYRMIAGLSVARGLDPDSPPFLNKITRTL